MPTPIGAPGVFVSVGAGAPAPTTFARTGTWFVTGEAQQGPTAVAIPITSMTDYANYLGTRPGYTTLYDSLDEFFHDGGNLVYVSRIVGPSAVNATHTLVDRAGSPLSTLSVTANGAGVWGNSATIAVANGSVSNTYVLTIVNGSNTWVSPNLTSPADAVTWATNLAGTTPWAFPFTIANLGSATASPNNNPAVISAVALSTGADDLTDVVEGTWTAALTAFQPNLGPGQVSAPGHTTTAGYEALIAHASSADASGSLINNRFALLDDADSSSAATVIAQVAAAQGGSGDSSFAMLLAPWVIIPGVPATVVGGAPVAATRTIPPSAFVAAQIASSDQSHNAGVPAAGANGQSSFAIGVTQTYVETDRASLDAAGVSVIRQFIGPVELYGYKTIATNPVWVSASFARMRMELADALNAGAQGFAFNQIDGQGHLIGSFNGALSGICQNYWQQGALYGATAAQAYQVNTGSTVNTPITIAAGQLNAVVSVRFSPYSEFVQISVIQYSVTQSLPS